MKCLNPLKICFHCLANGEWGGQNIYLNQSFRKFDEMPKSTKKKKNFFSLFGQWWEGAVKMFT